MDIGQLAEWRQLAQQNISASHQELGILAKARAVALCEIERRMKCDPDKTWKAPLQELLNAIQEHLFTDVQISPDNETRKNATALSVLIEHFREQHLPLERKAAE
jgi:hypothetical protein